MSDRPLGGEPLAATRTGRCVRGGCDACVTDTGVAGSGVCLGLLGGVLSYAAGGSALRRLVRHGAVSRDVVPASTMVRAHRAAGEP